MVPDGNEPKETPEGTTPKPDASKVLDAHAILRSVGEALEDKIEGYKLAAALQAGGEAALRDLQLALSGQSVKVSEQLDAKKITAKEAQVAKKFLGIAIAMAAEQARGHIVEKIKIEGAVNGLVDAARIFVKGGAPPVKPVEKKGRQHPGMSLKKRRLAEEAEATAAAEATQVKDEVEKPPVVTTSPATASKKKASSRRRR